MSETNRRLILVAPCVLLGLVSAREACAASDPVVPLKGARLEAMIYEFGRPIRKGELPVDSPVTEAVASLIKGKRSRWDWSLQTYAPGVYLRSEGFTINLHPDLVIVNSTTASGKSRQVVSKLDRVEYERVRAAISRALAR